MASIFDEVSRAYDLGRKIGDDIRSIRETGKNVGARERERKESFLRLQQEQNLQNKKYREEKKRQEQAKNFINYQFLPMIEEKQKLGLSNEQINTEANKMIANNPDSFERFFGKNKDGKPNFYLGTNIETSEPTGKQVVRMGKDMLSKFIDPSTVNYSLFASSIPDGGEGLFEINIDESGRYDIASLGPNFFAKQARSMNQDVSTPEKFNQFVSVVTTLYPILKQEGKAISDLDFNVLFGAGEKKQGDNNDMIKGSIIQSFNSVEEVEAANLPSGTKVMIDGRLAQVD